MAMTLGTLEYLISVKTGNLSSELGKAEGQVKGFGNKLSAWTVAKGQMIARFAEKAVTTTANMVKDTVKSAINAYATFEQLEGGTKLLFGSAYDFVMKKSSEAFKTVQISQNEYLEQANRYATGLKTSLKGDEQAAAELADRIITAQADVVAATGASRESVQNAFAGLLKGNYMMLDNLQLGIKGSQQGMKDVIKQVNKWNKANGKATKYQMGNLADMNNALIDYIEMQGLAGYANMEASKTLEGSISSTKAAWQDLLVSMGKGSGVKQAVKNFGTAAKNMLKNLKPVAKDAFKGLVDTAKMILPDIVQIGGDLVNEIGRGIFGKDWDITINWIQNAWSDVQDAFNVAVDWVGNAYKVTVEWIRKAWDTVNNAFTTAEKWINNAYTVTVEWVREKWDAVSDAFTEAGKWIDKTFNTTIEWVQNAWNDVSDAFTEAGKWVDEKINVAVEWAQTAWDNVSDAFTEAGKWIDKTFKTTIKWVQNAWGTVKNAFDKAGEWAGKAFDTTINWIRGTWDDVSEAFTLAGKKAWNTVVNFKLGLVDAVNSFIDKLKQGVNVVVNFLTGSTPKVPNTSDFGASNVGTDNFSPSSGGGGVNMPMTQAKGNWMVPYDNYPSLLHRGELVLTKSQARQFRDGEGGADAGNAIADAVTAAMSKVYVMMSGEKVGDLTTKRIKRNINASSYSRQRALGG